MSPAPPPPARPSDDPPAGPAAGSAAITPAEHVARAFEALGIEPDHAPAVEAEAAAWRERAALDDAPLEELTDAPFVTIDNPGSRDLDQALLVERDGEDYRIRYALADASWCVRPGSALFEAALARGASHYTPVAVAPMLPRALSEDLVSLEPDAVRRAVVFDMRLDATGRTLGTRVSRARIRSRAQLTYRGVQAFLDGAPRADEPIDAEYAPSLRRLREVGRHLERLARERDVIVFDRREVGIDVAGNPPRFVARERERLPVEDWNAAISLLCNAEGATLLAGLDGAEGDAAETDGTLEPIYRVHEAPPAARLAELRRQLDDWASELGLDDAWRWPRGRSLADYVEGLPDAPRERGRVRAVQRQILVRQRASTFRAEPGRHHALGLESYARFSSPMREIVGVFTHRELLDTLAGTGTPDAALRDAVIDAANAAKTRQKALDKAIARVVVADLLTADLARDPVPTRSGTVLGLRSGHLYVGLDDLALDLKVYAEDLERRHGTPYTLEGLRAVPGDPAKPAFAVGDAIGVRVVGHDADTGRFSLDAVPRGEAARRERRRARPG